MQSMFEEASSFNQDLGWTTSKVETMHKMFLEASTFNGNISKWKTSQVTDFSKMFRSASSFNQPLFWEMSKVKNICMSEMFVKPPHLTGI